jgi:hypothetical protein
MVLQLERATSMHLKLTINDTGLDEALRLVAAKRNHLFICPKKQWRRGPRPDNSAALASDAVPDTANLTSL